MAKAVKKEHGLFNKQDFLAVLLGLALIWVGGLLVSLNWGDLMNLNDTAWTQLCALIAILSYTFSGWLVVKKAKNKGWYMSIIPTVISLIVALIGSSVDGLLPLFGFLGAPAVVILGNSEVNAVYVFVIPLVLSLLGGYAATHLKIK